MIFALCFNHCTFPSIELYPKFIHERYPETERKPNADPSRASLKTAPIVFTPIYHLHLLKRHCSKFDVILFDDAHNIDEALSTMLFLFSPSAVVLFGDPYRSAIDSLGMQQKYPNHRLNESMFERLRKCGRCTHHLESQYRFGETISQFVGELYYGKRRLGCRKMQTTKPLDCMSIYHRPNDGYCYGFIEKMLQQNNAKNYNFTILYPPNVRREVLADASLR